MGKRSSFERNERDYYPTPKAAVLPLLPHLTPRTLFIEPCAGNGALVDVLVEAGHTRVLAFDIKPQRNDVYESNALKWIRGGPNFEYFITNPPWDRSILHPLITHLTAQAPTWLLFDADWVHTRQAVPYLHLLRKIVAVGRVKWIAGSPHTGKDNCCWHLFAQGETPTQFYGRT